VTRFLLRRVSAFSGSYQHRDLVGQVVDGQATVERSRHITRSIYNGWFTWGHQDGRITTNPMGRVPKIKNPPRRPKDIFDPVEIELLENLPSPDGELWTLLFKTGMRRGESRRLNRAHINLSRARLMVYDGKGGKDRVIPLPPPPSPPSPTSTCTNRSARPTYLWYSRPGGSRRRSRLAPIGDTTFEHWYRRGIEQAEVRYLNPHQTRHTYGWWLRAEGFDIEERQLLMGHESIRTTEEYYRFQDDLGGDHGGGELVERRVRVRDQQAGDLAAIPVQRFGSFPGDREVDDPVVEVLVCGGLLVPQVTQEKTKSGKVSGTWEVMSPVSCPGR
jgi:integrase